MSNDTPEDSGLPPEKKQDGKEGKSDLPHKEPKELTPIDPEELPVDPALKDLFLDIIEELPEEKKAEFGLRMISFSRTHSGPLPPAEDMEKYNKVIPNGADRIMIMAEKNNDDFIAGRQADRKLSSSGQKISTGLIVAYLAAGTFCVYQNMQGAAIACFTFGVAQAVRLFFVRDRKDQYHKIPSTISKEDAE